MSVKRRLTISFEEEVHQALKVKAAITRQTLSDLTNDAVRAALLEDWEALESVRRRAKERAPEYEAFLNELRASGKL